MDVTVNINAPAIVEAINKLTETFSAVLTRVQAPQTIEVVNAQPAQIAQNESTAPIQAQQTAPSNVTTPAANVAQSAPQPAQTAPIQQTAPAPAATAQAQPQIQQAAPTPAAVAQQTAPTTPAPAPAPAIDEAYRSRVCTAAARLVEQGKMAEMLALLQNFGAPSVVHLTAEQLPEFAAKITALGAVI
ncbi:hypothetical protein [Ruminococcus albus]|uniref:Uncharacterized protein n=1 Tax=Ruminococcus albus TaxID=1264 RepID=A0A1H7MRT5_RUMAL|nr:hypothetical protein [Ruminococcus albus]SEL13972.1 hypothetical protein SAMN05216469_112121 [Ruminococcus albus]